MKRLHVNLGVNNVEESVRFYSALFNVAPNVLKPDYAKWSLDDPSVNFSISLSSKETGVKHLGIEAGSEQELKEVYENISNAEGAVVREEGHTVCCYHQSEKSWVKDPQGVEWEAFHSYGLADVNKAEGSTQQNDEACCDEHCCA